MPLDSQAAGILQMFAGLPEPDYAALDATAYRAMVAQQSLPALNEPIAAVSEHACPVAGGTIALRMYRPALGTPPAIVFFHGGGWVACNLDTHDNLCRRLANRSGCAV